MDGFDLADVSLRRLGLREVDEPNAVLGAVCRERADRVVRGD